MSAAQLRAPAPLRFAGFRPAGGAAMSIAAWGDVRRPAASGPLFTRSKRSTTTRPENRARGDTLSSHQTCDSPLTDSQVIRAAYPTHTVKRLARTMSVPIETARHWLYRRLSSARRHELAVALLAEMDAQDVERSALRRRLAQWASE